MCVVFEDRDASAWCSLCLFSFVCYVGLSVCLHLFYLSARFTEKYINLNNNIYMVVEGNKPRNILIAIMLAPACRGATGQASLCPLPAFHRVAICCEGRLRVHPVGNIKKYNLGAGVVRTGSDMELADITVFFIVC